MRARRREQRLLNSKRALQKAMALRRKGSVAGKLRHRHRGPDVIKFIARCEWTIERNLDHDELNGLRPINKSDPPTGKERPFSISNRSRFKMLPKILLSLGLISNSRQGWNSRSRFCCMRDQTISGNNNELKEVIRLISKPAVSTFFLNSAQL